VTLSAQAKGAGMIQPSFATMLCFVQTDAALSAETADLLLGVCVKRSFDRISVDGQLSTNDTAILQCSGASGVQVAPESEDERPQERVVVRGGHAEGVERVARAVANSPLVKTALYGGDPNWGRYAQAIGAALPGAQGGRLAFDLSIEGIQIASAGQGVDHDAEELARRVLRDEVEVWIGLPGDGHEAECLFSDLGHEYVVINAEYTT
jgi:glutamate N-acetyltransferase/amino-acid N-acetyltransferase